MTNIPSSRVRFGNGRPLRSDGQYVLYWMTSFLRLEWNFALQHAVESAKELEKPLVVLEILRADDPFASRRFHSFILEGMAERFEALSGLPVLHYPFVERGAGEGDGLLAALAADACTVVTDDYPSPSVMNHLEREARKDLYRMEIVDSNGLLPLRATDRVFSAAYHFRRFLQKSLPDHGFIHPAPDPLSEAGKLPSPSLPPEVLDRWAPWEPRTSNGRIVVPTDFQGSRDVAPVESPGTRSEGLRHLDRFLEDKLSRYAEDGNHPDRDATSLLSPFLHFGVVSAHEVLAAVASHQGWTPLRLSTDTSGKRRGWWGMDEGPEAFLDQLVTWRELGFNMAWQLPNHTSFDSLPEWAQTTLAEHEGDPRPYLYSYEEFLAADTHDPLWNAAQRQLLEEGVIHNYLRMLWGKKILEWSGSPSEAAEIMVDLNDRFALDGRDPNSYSGIFWCLGRYDRGWPERTVFGKVRSMSSKRTMKKVELTEYLERYGD